MKKAQVIVVAGPTASGKSDFAVALALQNNGEIISADSRQVYKGLDIGTGKITHQEMKGVVHHMLDVFDVEDEVSVVTYQEMALPIMKDIIARGKIPIVCGGTGQYIDALIYDQALPQVPPNHTLRHVLENKLTEELVEELQKLDPHRLQAIGNHNRVRLIRAIEISRALGTVPQLEVPKLRFPTTMYIMHPTRKILHERITARLHKRFKEGMIEEVQGLIKKGITHKQLERLGLEYKYISLFLRGELTKEEMTTQLEFKTNQYGKRQETWLKKYLKDSRILLHVMEVK